MKRCLQKSSRNYSANVGPRSCRFAFATKTDKVAAILEKWMQQTPQNIRACLRKSEQLKGGENMNIAPISSLTSFRGQQAQTTVQTNDGNAFAHLLLSLRQQSALQPSPEQHMVQSIDWEALQQWLTQLPDDVTYADADMLSNEMIQSFLSFYQKK